MLKEIDYLRSLGMSDAQIETLLDFDKAQRNSDRRFYRHNVLNLEAISPFLPMPQQESESKDMLDCIDNQRLYAALSKLSEFERRLIKLHIIDGLSLALIAGLHNQSYASMQRRYHRAIQKLKKYFN